MKSGLVEEQSRGVSQAMRQLRAVILMGGSVRSTRFDRLIGRSVLDIPIEQGLSLLQHWQRQVAELVRCAELRQVSLRVLLDQDSPEPRMPAAMEGIEMTVERDPLEYRGTAGVLRDIGSNYQDEDYLLVANGAQLLTESMSGLAREMADRNGDVVVVAHRDGTPSGLMMIRGAMLREIPEVGFSDMKEQVLPLLAKKYRVEVVDRERPSGLPIRNPEDYINALRSYYQRKEGKSARSAYEEDWHSAFALVEDPTAAVSRAWLHDSVVLKGARVEDRAVMVRSIACPGAVVRRGEMHVDELIESGKGWAGKL
jgi:hypothetical protein